MSIDNLTTFMTALASLVLAFSSICGLILTTRSSDRKMEGWQKSQQIDIDFLRNESIVQMRALLALCTAMKTGNVNGEVSKSIAEINEFLLNNAHHGVSHG